MTGIIIPDFWPHIKAAALLQSVMIIGELMHRRRWGDRRCGRRVGVVVRQEADSDGEQDKEHEEDKQDAENLDHEPAVAGHGVKVLQQGLVCAFHVQRRV